MSTFKVEEREVPSNFHLQAMTWPFLLTYKSNCNSQVKALSMKTPAPFHRRVLQSPRFKLPSNLACFVRGRSLFNTKLQLHFNEEITIT